ncbi:hypothetical protein H4R35_002255 [Dimargaris xerosporica]|nr:hypothetical protein H4R35_002255 [Dimargaris xerosporica]
MANAIRRSRRLATKQEPVRPPGADPNTTTTPLAGAAISVPKNQPQPPDPAHSLTMGGSEQDFDTASQISTSSPPTKKRRRQAKRKYTVAPPKTWDELVAQHQQAEQAIDLSQYPMAYFCRGRSHGLPMKSTVERAWELYRQKQAETAGEADSVEPPLPLQAEAPEEVVGLIDGAEGDEQDHTETPSLSPKVEDGKPSKRDGDDDDDKKEPLAEDDQMYATNRHAPQVKIVNGKIAVNEESTVIGRGEINAEETAAAHQSMEVVDEGRTSRYINCMTYVNKKREKLVRWSMDDTVQFYELLARYGTDFNMMAEGFNGKRTRGQCKNKFKREEMIRPWLITRALLNKPVRAAELASAPGTPKPSEMEAKSVPADAAIVTDSRPLASNPTTPVLPPADNPDVSEAMEGVIAE